MMQTVMTCAPTWTFAHSGLRTTQTPIRYAQTASAKTQDWRALRTSTELEQRRVSALPTECVRSAAAFATPSAETRVLSTQKMTLTAIPFVQNRIAARMMAKMTQTAMARAATLIRVLLMQQTTRTLINSAPRTTRALLTR